MFIQFIKISPVSNELLHFDFLAFDKQIFENNMDRTVYFGHLCFRVVDNPENIKEMLSKSVMI